MKILPDRHTILKAQESGQTLGRGMDFALVVLVFLGLGWALDTWLGTRPGFMVGLVVFSVIGQFVKMYYEYTATMQALESQRSVGGRSSVATAAGATVAAVEEPA